MSWHFTDPSDSSTYTLPAGPRTFNYSYSRTEGYGFLRTTTTGGTAFIANNNGSSGDMSGTLITQAQYLAMISWWQKKGPIVITDPLSRQWTVYILECDQQRVYSARSPWKHNWTMKFNIVSVEEP